MSRYAPMFLLLRAHFFKFPFFFIIIHRFHHAAAMKIHTSAMNFMACHSSCVFKNRWCRRLHVCRWRCWFWCALRRHWWWRSCALDDVVECRVCQGILKIWTNCAVTSMFNPSWSWVLDILFIDDQFSQTCVDTPSFQIEWPSHMQDRLCCKMKDHRFPLHKSQKNTFLVCFRGWSSR